MEDHRPVSKIANQLLALSNSELRSLKSVLTKPEGRHVILSLIEQILDLRATQKQKISERNLRQQHEISAASKVVPRQSTQSEYLSTDDVKEAFISFFSDKNQFTSTQDVVNALNRAFNCHIDYKTFRKRGRRDVINKCWSNLLTLPEKKRTKILSTFFKEQANKKTYSDAYRELFRILTNK
jgi:hypothetical protein